ncbi:hypothetical protein EVAR_76843_1 [Eumeta japonica]|uniref:Uncharacterized protein n=1 Tax=Eumeta variegata TaxID=151549 RepID=A0A4C1YVV6_EUMVA|nr:hypothetical protein EVAR_76843_1 [Eumeta japonica]
MLIHPPDSSDLAASDLYLQCSHQSSLGSSHDVANLRLQYVNGPAPPMQYHTLTEYTRKEIITAAAFRPDSDSSSDPLPFYYPTIFLHERLPAPRAHSSSDVQFLSKKRQCTGDSSGVTSVYGRR